jgi:hypothetical protein
MKTPPQNTMPNKTFIAVRRAASQAPSPPMAITWTPKATVSKRLDDKGDRIDDRLDRRSAGRSQWPRTPSQPLNRKATGINNRLDRKATASMRLDAGRPHVGRRRGRLE